MIHTLSHPSIRATVQLVTEKFVWHAMKKDITAWTRTCVSCQRSKIHRHTKASVGSFHQPTRRFGHIHVDIVGPLPSSEGKRYLFTIIDRSTRWPEAIPMEEPMEEICTGVPQGSILGPLFFSVYINDLITVSKRLNFLMYADDTTIYFNYEDFDLLTRETDINRELEKVNIWLKLNKLSLNTQKTKLMLFHRKQKHFDKISVVINGIEIEHVPSFNFLGIMLDENLSWKSHIEMVGNKISKVTGILYRLKNVFPENVLFVLYNSLIVSYINYGLLLWGTHSHKLELLQKRALRFMTNSSYRAHTTPLLIKHGLLNVRDMYKLKLLKFYYKLSYDLLPPYFNNYIDIIEQKPARDLRFQFIHAPLVKRVYAECSPLFQLIKLINSLKNDANDTILKKIDEKSHSYNGFAFNVTRCFLDTYDPICRIENCYVCKFQ